MVLRQYEDNCIQLHAENMTKERIEKIAREYKTTICYINNEPEHDYNLSVSDNDWCQLMESIENPKYNEDLAKFMQDSTRF